MELWKAARDPKGTLVETYLKSRFVSLPEGCQAIRFHEACPWQEKTCPAMIGLFYDCQTLQPVAIHRTLLTPDGQKLATGYLGSVQGAIIPLTKRGSTLLVGEGIETTLSGIELGLSRNAWACGDAGNLENLPVIDGVDRLIVAVDNDKSGRGDKAANTLAERWRNAGKEVALARSETVGQDLNSLLGGRYATPPD